MSHELRTPLASIKGFASTLLADDVEWEPEAQREFLSVISEESDRLSDLVTDLLDLSRIEAGNLSVDRTLVDLDKLIRDSAEQARLQPGNMVDFEIQANLPDIAIDQRRIQVVIRNLVENAAKYGDPGAPISIKAIQENGEVIVSVRDQGPGIPDSYSDQVFEPFFRLEEGLSLVTPGAGLGLSICQGFVEAHGGRIWLSPVPDGTRVNFSLPLEEA